MGRASAKPIVDLEVAGTLRVPSTLNALGGQHTECAYHFAGVFVGFRKLNPMGEIMGHNHLEMVLEALNLRLL